MPRVSDKQLTEWLVPALLATLIGVLGWMAVNIADISKSLGIAVTRIEEHERRLENLETLYLRTPR